MSALLNFMHGFGARAQAWAEALGGPGLLLVAAIDSSFVTLPEVADILVVLFAIRSPADWPYFALMTTTGSVAGCYVLYLIGRKGGEALLRRRFHERHVDRGLAWFKKYGAMVLVIPAMLPPPMPFKLFVLLAGVAGVAAVPFTISVAVGRGARYGTEAFLATLYGEQALRFVQDNAFKWAIPALIAALVPIVVWWLWRRLLRGDGTDGPAPDQGGPKADVE